MKKYRLYTIAGSLGLTVMAIGVLSFTSVFESDLKMTRGATCARHSGTVYTENLATSEHTGNAGYFICCSCHEILDLVDDHAPEDCDVERTITNGVAFSGDIHESRVYTYISLNKGDGTGGTSFVNNALKNVDLPDIELPTYTMHSFLGYFDQQAGGTQYYSSTGKSVHTNDLADSATLFAHWAVDQRDVKIDVAGGTKTFSVLEGNSGKMVLPVVTATDCYGEPLTPVVTYKFNGVDATNPGYKTDAAWTSADYGVGSHEWTFTATDTHEGVEVKQAATETIKLDVCPIVLADNRGGSFKIGQTTELNPKVYLTCNQGESGSEARAFNMDASQKYYAEFTINKAQKASGIGLVHSAESTNNGFTKEYLRTNNLSTVDVKKSYNYETADDKHIIWNGPFTKFQEGLDRNRSFNIDNWTSKQVKLGIGRNGDMFYFFIDDVMVEATSSSLYHNVNTVPGIYFEDSKVGLDGQVAENLVLLSGDAAVNKINTISSTSGSFGYIRNDNNNYTTCSENNGVLTYEAVDGQQYYNCLVGSKTLLKGSNHIHFRYECNEYNVGSDDYSLFSISRIDSGFAADPNQKNSQIASWVIRHNNSYNSTILFANTPTESPWSYTKAFGGDGTNFRWDVAAYDIDIYIRLGGKDGKVYNIQYVFTEYAKHGAAPIDTPNVYSSPAVDSTVLAAGAQHSSSWYMLNFQAHNKCKFSISNLLIEPIVE